MRKRKKKNFQYSLIIAAILIFIVFVLLISSLNQNKKLNFFEVIIKDGTLSIYEFLSTPFTSPKRDDLDSIAKVRAENDSLKLALAELQKEKSVNYSDAFKHISAKIITRNIGTWYNQVTINKGATDGLKPGMAVMNNDGLVGITKTTSNHFTDVMLITSNQSNLIIPAEILSLNSREFGYIKGYHPEINQLVFNKINHQVDAKIGDYVTTSSISGSLPSGLKIGIISKIIKDEYGIVNRFYVEPVTSNHNMLYVTVLAQ